MSSSFIQYLVFARDKNLSLKEKLNIATLRKSLKEQPKN